MTKQEVLQGALLLNGDGKNYVVTIDGDRIIVEIKYKDAYVVSPRSLQKDVEIFRVIAHLYEDNTYRESHQNIYTKSGFDRFLRGGMYGNVSKVEKSISFGYNNISSELGPVKVSFNSKTYKRILRDYLSGCGYSKKGLFKRIFKK